MYCKYCGQQIDDDSCYCKHCGKMISGTSCFSTISNRMLKRFTTLSIKKQLIILLCSIVYFLWICIIIENADKDYFTHDYIAPFFWYGLFFPYLAICLWYIYRKIKFQRIRKHTILIKANECQTTRQHNATYNITVRSLVNSVKLLEFANRHGKMQVVSNTCKNKEAQKHYCLFTTSDGQTIKVGFSKQIATFEAKDISENKHALCVNHYNDNTFELDYISDQQICDSIPI